MHVWFYTSYRYISFLHHIFTYSDSYCDIPIYISYIAHILHSPNSRWCRSYCMLWFVTVYHPLFGPICLPLVFIGPSFDMFLAHIHSFPSLTYVLEDEYLIVVAYTCFMTTFQGCKNPLSKNVNPYQKKASIILLVETPSRAGGISLSILVSPSPAWRLHHQHDLLTRYWQCLYIAKIIYELE